MPAVAFRTDEFDESLVAQGGESLCPLLSIADRTICGEFHPAQFEQDIVFEVCDLHAQQDSPITAAGKEKSACR